MAVLYKDDSLGIAVNTTGKFLEILPLQYTRELELNIERPEPGGIYSLPHPDEKFSKTSSVDPQLQLQDWKDMDRHRK
ncbi:hypothetical protein HispidOSU_004172, partial [Sigmodon hispidus]